MTPNNRAAEQEPLNPDWRPFGRRGMNIGNSGSFACRKPDRLGCDPMEHP